MRLSQFKPCDLKVKIVTTPSGRGGDFLHTDDPNFDNFMGELLLTAIKRLAIEKDEYLLEFFTDNFGVDNFEDILNIDITKILKKIEIPYIYDDDDYVGCIGWETGDIKGLFDAFCKDGKFDEEYLKYYVGVSEAGVSMGYLKIIE